MKKRGEYRSVNIPEYLIQEIEQRIENDPTFRYPTKARFIIQAIIEKLEKEDEKKTKES